MSQSLSTVKECNILRQTTPSYQLYRYHKRAWMNAYLIQGYEQKLTQSIRP
jgi:hypothetical protein